MPIVEILLHKVLTVADHYESRCPNYFEGLTALIETVHQPDLLPLQKLIESLIFRLSDEILKREIKEKNTQDIDHLLKGKMQLLKVLL